MALDRDPNHVFRDFVTDGIPSSGNWNPRKPEIRQLLTEWWQTLIALVADAGGLELPNLLIRYEVTGGDENDIVAEANLPVPSGPGVAVFSIVIEEANTGPVTINGKPLLSNTGNPLAAGALAADGIYLFLDNGDSYRLLSDYVSSSIVAAAEAAAVIASGAAGQAIDAAERAEDAAAGVEFPVSYAPQTLTPEQQEQARENIGLTYREQYSPDRADGPTNNRILIGEDAGASISPTASSLIAIGKDAARDVASNNLSIAIGSGAMGNATTSPFNIAIGDWSLSHYSGTIGRNIAIGTLSAHFLTEGYQNVFIGRDSGHAATTQNQSVGIGYRALYCGYNPRDFTGRISNQYTVTGVGQSVAVGESALTMFTGEGATAVGFHAAWRTRRGQGITAIGWNAAQGLDLLTSENLRLMQSKNLSGTYTQTGTTITITATGHGCVAGRKVGISFQSGPLSLGGGVSTGGDMQWLDVASVLDSNTFTLTSSESLTASGECVISLVETDAPANSSWQVTAIGHNALGNTTASGLSNVTSVGANSGRVLGTGSSATVLLGSSAGANLTYSDASTFIGHNAGSVMVDGSDLTSAERVTTLGWNARVSGNDQVQIGGSTTTTYVYGTVQNRSDARDKADVRDTILGLDFINRLRPVDFKWDMRDDYIEVDPETGEVTKHEKDGSKKRNRYHHGLIAQDVKRVMDEMGIDFGGYQDHSVNGGADVLSIGYDELIAPLIKAVQELTERVEELEDALSNRK